MNLNVRSKKIFAVVMPPSADISFLYDGSEALMSYLKENTLHWAFIAHFMDVEPDGNYKRPHIHLYCEYLECKRIGTRMNELADVFNLKPIAVSVQKVKSDSGCIRYLIHKDNPEKVQYPVDMVRHNFSQEEFDILISSPDDSLNVSRVLDICRNSNSLVEVMQELGLSMYRAYRPVIIDAWKVIKHGC